MSSMNLQGQMMRQLEQLGAIITGSHVVYTSGKHGSAYVNKDAIYPHTKLISQLCLEIAKHFVKDHEIDVVIAPAVGGVILSQWVAYHLTILTGKEVLGVYAEKQGDGFVIRRGYEQLCRSKKVLVVEDILNTGGSVRKVVDAVRALPAEVVGVAALCNRGGVGTKELGEVPEVFALMEIALDAWEPEHCPLCKKGVPVNNQVGKGIRTA